MAVPLNITPATATIVAALPYTVSQTDIFDAPQGAGYASTCAPDQFHAVWYQYTAQANEYLIGINVNKTGGGGYDPLPSIWVGTLPGVTQHILVSPSGDSEFCESLEDFWFKLPVTPGTTYWIQIADSANAASNGDGFTLQVLAVPALAVPAGAIAVSDDSDFFPLMVLSPTTGAVIRALPFPAGESYDNVLTGETCHQNGETNDGVAIYSAAVTLIGTQLFAGQYIQGITSDRNANFYVMTQPQSAFADPLTVHMVSKGNVLSGTTWTLPANSAFARCFAVARDGSILYYCLHEGVTPSPIRRFDLVNNIALSDLAPAFAGEVMFSFSDGFVDLAGNIWFGYHDIFTPNSGRMRQFSPAGAVLQTINILTAAVTAAFGRPNHYAFADDSPGTFWVWWNPSATLRRSVFQQWSIGAGALLTEIEDVVTGSKGSGEVPFFISSSCPVIVLQAAIAAPIPPGPGDGTCAADLGIGVISPGYSPPTPTPAACDWFPGTGGAGVAGCASPSPSASAGSNACVSPNPTVQ